jgi:hypothetical protein
VVVLGVLVIILRRDWVAGTLLGLGKRKVALITFLRVPRSTVRIRAAALIVLWPASLSASK